MFINDLCDGALVIATLPEMHYVEKYLARAGGPAIEQKINDAFVDLRPTSICRHVAKLFIPLHVIGHSDAMNFVSDVLATFIFPCFVSPLIENKFVPSASNGVLLRSGPA